MSDQSDFTKARAAVAAECADAIFKALPKSLKMELLGELNDLLLFIEAAKRAAPAVKP